VGQADVDDEDVRGLLADALEQLTAAAGGDDLVALVAQASAQRRAQLGVVLGDGDAGLHDGYRMADALVRTCLVALAECWRRLCHRTSRTTPSGGDSGTFGGGAGRRVRVRCARWPGWRRGTGAAAQPLPRPPELVGSEPLR